MCTKFNLLILDYLQYFTSVCAQNSVKYWQIHILGGLMA